MIVHVHAYATSNNSVDPTYGFRWFRDPEEAARSFSSGSRTPSDAHFLIECKVDSSSDKDITSEIECFIEDLMAHCENRFVGDDVAAQWQQNGRHFGDNNGPAWATLSP